MQIKEEKKIHTVFFIFLIQKYAHFWMCFFYQNLDFFIDDIEFEIENNFNDIEK